MKSELEIKARLEVLVEQTEKGIQKNFWGTKTTLTNQQIIELNQEMKTLLWVLNVK